MGFLEAWSILCGTRSIFWRFRNTHLTIHFQSWSNTAFRVKYHYHWGHGMIFRGLMFILWCLWCRKSIQFNNADATIVFLFTARRRTKWILDLFTSISQLARAYSGRAVCFKINFFISYKFLISFADRIYRPVIDQLKYYYIVLIFYQIHVKSISCSMIDQLCVFSFSCD